jgi:hypothetical protein
MKEKFENNINIYVYLRKYEDTNWIQTSTGLNPVAAHWDMMLNLLSKQEDS